MAEHRRQPCHPKRPACPRAKICLRDALAEASASEHRQYTRDIANRIEPHRLAQLLQIQWRASFRATLLSHPISCCRLCGRSLREFRCVRVFEVSLKHGERWNATSKADPSRLLKATGLAEWDGKYREQSPSALELRAEDNVCLFQLDSDWLFQDLS